MNRTVTTFSRNLFEIDNAKSLRRDELVATFVPTQSYWRLLSARNHIVLGSRGSGKTALVKMLSHDHMAAWSNEQARASVERCEFIGVYVPMDLEWIGTLRRPWLDEDSSERFFQWRLNVALSHALLSATASCLRTYVPDLGDRARHEAAIAKELGELWLESSLPRTLDEVEVALNKFTAGRLQHVERSRVLGTSAISYDGSVGFDQPLLAPFRRATDIVQRTLRLPEHATWIVAFDEAEFLEAHHQRMINTVMRSHLGNVAIKVTTMPYFYSLDTNARVSLDAGHDFDYLYVDHDPVSATNEFAKKLFYLRRDASSHPQDLTIEQLLGASPLLDPQLEREDDQEFLAGLGDHVNAATLARANHLASTDPAKFRDQIVRKLAGAVTLRRAVADTTGNRALTVYSGMAMVLRCSDRNPRRLVGLYNELLQAASSRVAPEGRRRRPMIPRTIQTRVLTSFSKNALSRANSIEEFGPAVHKLLDRVGTFMHGRLHDYQLGTDTTTSIIVDESVDEYTWRLVKAAAGRGLLYPNTTQTNPEPWPDRRGVFHLAYVLAPHFRLLPRRGKAVQLSRVLSERTRASADTALAQLGLFEIESG